MKNRFLAGKSSGSWGICVCDRVHEEAGVNLRRHSQESSTLLWDSSLSGLNG